MKKINWGSIVHWRTVQRFHAAYVLAEVRHPDRRMFDARSGAPLGVALQHGPLLGWRGGGSRCRGRRCSAPSRSARRRLPSRAEDADWAAVCRRRRRRTHDCRGVCGCRTTLWTRRQCARLHPRKRHAWLVFDRFRVDSQKGCSGAAKQQASGCAPDRWVTACRAYTIVVWLVVGARRTHRRAGVHPPRGACGGVWCRGHTIPPEAVSTLGARRSRSIR